MKLKVWSTKSGQEMMYEGIASYLHELYSSQLWPCRDRCKSPQMTQLQSNSGLVLRIITLWVIWLLCSGTLAALEVAQSGNAVPDREATAGGCRYDWTLMEEEGRRLRYRDIGYRLSQWPSERTTSEPEVGHCS